MLRSHRAHIKERHRCFVNGLIVHSGQGMALTLNAHTIRLRMKLGHTNFQRLKCLSIEALVIVSQIKPREDFVHSLQLFCSKDQTASCLRVLGPHPILLMIGIVAHRLHCVLRPNKAKLQMITGRISEFEAPD